MHASDEKLVGGHHVEDCPARRLRLSGVGVERHAGFRPGGLHFRNMHRVAPNQQLLLAGGDKIGRMPRGVAGTRDRGDAANGRRRFPSVPAIGVGTFPISRGSAMADYSKARIFLIFAIERSVSACLGLGGNLEYAPFEPGVAGRA